METDAVAPQNVYGHSKLQGEQAVRQMNPEHVIARTAWVYSPVGANFVKTMLRLAGERDSLRVVDDQIGNPTYAPHLAQALLEIARKVRHAPRDGQWGTYHLAGQGEVSWCGFAREVFRVSAELGGPSADVTPITHGGVSDACRAAEELTPRLQQGGTDVRRGATRLARWRARVRHAVVGQGVTALARHVPVRTSPSNDLRSGNV